MRTEAWRRGAGGALACVFLVACGSAPKPAEAPLRKQALEAESEGARRFTRGDYARAAQSFGAAARLQQSLDDDAGVARNQLHQARAELAAGQAEAALGRALRIDHPPLAVDVLLLQAQANLGLGRFEAAQAKLAAAADLCPATCSRSSSLALLQARAALATGKAAPALQFAEAALKLLQDGDETAEIGNAWRIIGAARLALGDAATALPAARAALEIDRQLGAPEKIARDWLLIGDIQQRTGAVDAATAYGRALDVAQAAGLEEVARIAAQALQKFKPQQGNSR